MSLATTMNLVWQVVAQDRLMWIWSFSMTITSPLLDTRWEDEEISTARLFNIREQILLYERNIIFIVEAHFQEVIHPRWIFVLARGLFLKHLCEEWVCWPQWLHGWRLKQWYFIWLNRSQCCHLIICCGSCGRGPESEIVEGELSWRNPALWNWMCFE